VRVSDFGRFALSTCAAVALLAGCGGSQPPIGALGSMPQTSTIATHAQRGKSWMLPEAKSEDLLYSSDYTANVVFVYSYPKAKAVGVLTGFSAPLGECVDKTGDVWIVNAGTANVVEYAHGGTAPIAALSDPGVAPLGCSIDPTSGNLALADEGGHVFIYTGGHGVPMSYSDPDISSFLYCTYDDAGNLFADGDRAGNLVAELPKGGSALTNITLNEALVQGSMQWDGQNLAMADLSGEKAKSGPTRIRRVRISGTTGTIVGTTLLESKKNRRVVFAVQYWIQGHTIIGPSQQNKYPRIVTMWRYPQGGKATVTLRAQKAILLWGNTVSLAPH
jgi:hypothetical protein